MLDMRVMTRRVAGITALVLVGLGSGLRPAEWCTSRDLINGTGVS